MTHRHGRQMRLAEVGSTGQAGIAAACVEVGAVGLSAEVTARYLAGAGVGTIRGRGDDLAATIAAVDPSLRVEVVAGMSPPPVSDDFDLRDPVARDVARGARVALRALRAVLAERGL
jgi:hypothetical protein